jgi:hypothetical protein
VSAPGTEFMDQAVCAHLNPDYWSMTYPWQTEVARRICGRCPVRDACEAYGRSNRLDGVWGGQPLIEGRLAEPGRSRTVGQVECEAAGCRRMFPQTDQRRRFCSPTCQKAEQRARGRRDRVIHRPVDVKPTPTLRETSGSDSINLCDDGRGVAA